MYQTAFWRYFSVIQIIFFHLLEALNETSTHHYTPELNSQSLEWFVKKPPNRTKTLKSAANTLACSFGDACRIILIYYLEKGKKSQLSIMQNYLIV